MGIKKAPETGAFLQVYVNRKITQCTSAVKADRQVLGLCAELLQIWENCLETKKPTRPAVLLKFLSWVYLSFAVL